ncbi:Cupredoxin [Bisporella sp. PMI_857]|nr:Cupredoxin [Bisporella sp. PMI_857]
MLLINGTYPGPTLVADWGDDLEITVINRLSDNGTSMHWHGFVQKNSNIADGVNGVTECPIVPNGGSKVYRFRATQHGTTWYHSHFSAQYGDGVVGTFIINGPASSDYAIDLGTFPISDFYYENSYQLAFQAARTGPPTARNLVFNGTNTNAAGLGRKNVTPLTPGKKHRLRIINTSVDQGFYVSLDGHQFHVIEADFVPVTPFTTTWLFIGIGQRYDVIIDANQTAGNYWFRASLAAICGANARASNMTSIFNYVGVPVANPTTTGAALADNACIDPLASLHPYTPKAVDSSTFTLPGNIHNLSGILRDNQGLFTWNIDGTPINVDWGTPTLEYVVNDNNNYPDELVVHDIPNANQWVFWIIQNLGFIPHPIHLHGHDFHILGAKANTQFSATEAQNLNFADPMRRDVATLPGSGYLVIAFKTDNPGAWLMHCHIAWHVSEGLAVQFLERKSEIASAMDLSHLADECQAWDTYYATSPYKKDDSGLRQANPKSKPDGISGL